ncbi:protein FEZ-like [Citrus clementina]|nr:protein FEZ-like [Citrus x clementina]
MESHGGFRSLPTIEEVVTTLILLCAALYSQLKSEMESLMGFRFQPSNEQIICLLEKKRLNPRFLHHTIKDIDDICSLEPWDLAGASKTESEDQVCYFFYKPYYKYKESTRAHRRTNAGYWKVTGRGSKIKTRNGLSGIKKILTFYYHGPASKKAKTGWVMHEYHVNDDPSYKKEFVLCRIERKCENKHGISTSDEGESRQQLVSPIQLSPRDPRNLSEENTPTYSQQLPNHNLISCPGNHIEQNTPTFPQVIPNASWISPTDLLSSDHLNSNRNHILANQQLQPNHYLISPFGNQIEPDSNSNSFPRNLIGQYTLEYPQLLPNHGSVSPTELLPSDHLISNRNHIEGNIITNQQLQPHQNLIYHFGDQIEQISPTNPWLPPNRNLISFPGNLIEQLPSDHLISKQNLSEENSLKNLHLQPNHNSISNFGNQIKENSPTNPQLPLNSNLDSLLLNQPMVLHSSCSFVNYDISDYQINSDQVNDLINSQRAFQGENSRKDTGQTLTPDLNSSKSDGGTSTYAEDSSDPNNTAYIDAWLDEPLEDGGASTYAKDSSDPNNIAYIDTWLDEPLEAGRASTLAEDSSDTNNTAYMDGWINGLLL